MRLSCKVHTTHFLSLPCHFFYHLQVFAESKDEISLVLFGTDGTENTLASEDQYQHITVHRHLFLPDFDLLEDIQNVIQPGTGQGDSILSECWKSFLLKAITIFT